MKHILSLAVMLAAAPAAPADGVEILNVVAHRYGANYNFNYDMYMRNGWSVTDAGVTDSVLPCHGSLPVLEMDTLLQDVGAAGDFDAVCLMPATWRYQPGSSAWVRARKAPAKRNSTAVVSTARSRSSQRCGRVKVASSASAAPVP